MSKGELVKALQKANNRESAKACGSNPSSHAVCSGRPLAQGSVGCLHEAATAALGSAVFFLVAPCVVAGVVPWLLTRWQFGPPCPHQLSLPSSAC